MSPSALITTAELNRATLARQHLLERTTLSAIDLTEHLLGVQAQEANSWYTTYWSRLEGFDPLEVSGLIEQRELVRIALMRSTIHLVSTRDAWRLRPLIQPAVAKPLTGAARRRLMDTIGPLVAQTTVELLSERPLTNSQLGRELAARWPEFDPLDLAMAGRVSVPLVQIPPRGLWGQRGAARHVPLASWTSMPDGAPMTVDEFVMRYLAALGPATPADATEFSRITHLGEVFDRLGSSLVELRTEDGRRVYDLPDAPRPLAQIPSPVRFLADFDNLLLGHADRSRFVSRELYRRLIDEIGMYSYGSVLADGRVAGLWRIEKEQNRATMAVKLVSKVSRILADEIEREGRALLTFWAPDAEHEYRAVSLDL